MIRSTQNWHVMIALGVRLENSLFNQFSRRDNIYARRYSNYIELRWTPTAADIGTYTSNVIITDQVNTVTQPITIEVRPAQAPPVFDNASTFIGSNNIYVVNQNLSVETGQELTYQVQASDPDGDNINYAISFGPEGMTINEQGEVSWVASEDDIRPVNFGVLIDDGNGAYTHGLFTVEVFGFEPDKSSLANEPLIDAFVGQEYSYRIRTQAQNGYTGLVRVALISGPPGMTITYNFDQTYTLNWIPQEGDCQRNVVLELRQPGVIPVQQNFTIDVHSAPKRLFRFQCSADAASCPAN